MTLDKNLKVEKFCINVALEKLERMQNELASLRNEHIQAVEKLGEKQNLHEVPPPHFFWDRKKQEWFIETDIPASGAYVVVNLKEGTQQAVKRGPLVNIRQRGLRNPTTIYSYAVDANTPEPTAEKQDPLKGLDYQAILQAILGPEET